MPSQVRKHFATLVHLKDGDGEVVETREVAWPDNSLELELSPSIPWATRISLQTSVLDSALGESDTDSLKGEQYEAMVIMAILTMITMTMNGN